MERGRGEVGGEKGDGNDEERRRRPAVERGRGNVGGDGRREEGRKAEMEREEVGEGEMGGVGGKNEVFKDFG